MDDPPAWPWQLGKCLATEAISCPTWHSQQTPGGWARAGVCTLTGGPCQPGRAVPLPWATSVAVVVRGCEGPGEASILSGSETHLQG